MDREPTLRWYPSGLVIPCFGLEVTGLGCGVAGSRFGILGWGGGEGRRISVCVSDSSDMRRVQGSSQ